MRKAVPASSSASSATRATKESLLMGELFFEKCALDRAQEFFREALGAARKAGDTRAALEAVTGLLRLADEARDASAVQAWEDEVERLTARSRKTKGAGAPPMIWYCKGAVARHRSELKKAQLYFHRYLKAVREDRKPSGTAQVLGTEDATARAWAMLGIIFMQRGHHRRAQVVGEAALARYEPKSLRRVNGNLYLLLAKVAERRLELDRAMSCYQRAHSAFLAEHNWYYHLHVLLGYARLARIRKDNTEALWYLDLVSKATAGSEFGALRNAVQIERQKIEQDAVDLLIDSRKGIVQTRDSGKISMRKQYVLLNILEALSASPNGLSKAEIIRAVWNESYRPEAHDNKLYYNINRLRKLIEPDMREPRYLQNWKEGYRLAPGLRVQLVGSSVSAGTRS